MRAVTEFASAIVSTAGRETVSVWSVVLDVVHDKFEVGEPWLETRVAPE